MARDKRFDPVDMEKGVVTSKGQLVIPVRLRRKYRIRKGTPVCFVEQGQDILLRPLTDAYIDGLRGSLRTGGRVLRALMAEKKMERDR